MSARTATTWPGTLSSVFTRSHSITPVSRISMRRHSRDCDRRTTDMIRLYDYLPSGNGYKVRLLFTQLATPFERVELDILKGITRTPDFLRKNLNGRIPVVELENGKFLAESNAILFYFAEGTPFFPTNRWERAQVLQWMFFEQYSHEPNIATSRFWLQHFELTPERKAGLA